MKADSPLSPAEYKQAIKKKLRNFSYIGEERFSGHFIGPFFFITHHCYWEWNRRITAEMNNAIGFIRQTPTGTRVHYIRSRGAFQPFYFLSLLLIFMVLSTVIGLFNGLVQYWNEYTMIIPFLSIVMTVFAALVTAAQAAFTENGKVGRQILDYFMGDPTMGKGA